MNIDLNGVRVLVTGASGFLGRHLLYNLEESRARTLVLTHDAVDLCDPFSTIHAFNKFGSPDYVFHLAGYNGGIAFNAKEPARIFADNTMMALNVMEACRHHKVKKLVSVVASCAYPKLQDKFYDTDWSGNEAYVKNPTEVCQEYEFLDGPPHYSVACHGYAKRNLQLASKFYHAQYGLNAICVCPPTLYGPGDRTDPDRTKVMGAFIKKFVDAERNGEQKVVCWGTGSPLREFMYVEDAAKLLIHSLLKFEDSSHPLNLGSGQEFSIKEVAEKVAAAVPYTGSIRWDESKPDGQYRKRLDVTRMNVLIPDFKFTSLEDGIARTVEWYRSCK